MLLPHISLLFPYTSLFRSLDQAAVGAASPAARDRLGDDRAAGVGRHVDHLGSGVLLLALAGECHRERLAASVLAHQPDGRVLHGDLGAAVAVDPSHGAAPLATGALGDLVLHVVS